MTATMFRSEVTDTGVGLGHLIRAEWTKFRTVRGWPIGMLVAALVTVAVGLVGPAGTTVTCSNPTAPTCALAHTPPTGPNGEPVHDGYYFVHQAVTGDGSITVRVTSLTGYYPINGSRPANLGPLAGLAPGVQPWTKAGVLITPGTRPGAAYAAVTVTGGHGVRMQYDYTHDVAGLPGAVTADSPRWLRLTRHGDALTGANSTDGTHWHVIGSTTMAGLPSTVQAGMFTTSPAYTATSHSFGRGSSRGGPTQATAAFDQVSLRANGSTGAWQGTDVGGAGGAVGPSTGYRATPTGFTVSGTGDIAPLVAEAGETAKPIETGLVGMFAGLIAVIVVAAMFMTAEYRRDLIRTTLSASPRRSRVLAAKSIVVDAVGFVTGLVSAGLAVPVVAALERAKGLYMFPASTGAEVRVVLGTAALVAVAAVLAVSAGTIVRRGAGAVTVVIVAIVLPYLLSVASVLPQGAAEWLLRVTPAAAFAIQQTVVRYPQVAASYSPTDGYFPLPPWAGFGVLCAYTAVALVAATVLLRRRDA
jgi:ABC-type transport system involved in multi-copper enzyme maturation permease subunit